VTPPADPGSDSGRPVHQGIVVGHHPGRPSVGLEVISQTAQALSQIGIVVVTCVGGDAQPTGTHISQPRSRRSPGRYDQRAGSVQDAAGIGGTLWVPVCELHPSGQPGGSPTFQLRSDLGEGAGIRHTYGIKSGRATKVDQLGGQLVSGQLHRVIVSRDGPAE
jgi:hypothetical protein